MHDRLNKNYRFRNHLKGLKADPKTATHKVDLYIHNCNERIKNMKGRLKELLEKNKTIRSLNDSLLKKSDIISVFDSTLTRTIGIESNTFSEEMLVIQSYFLDVLRDLIKDGFIFKDEKYVLFTASAGQIRTKKTVFIKESTYNKHINSLMCGLSLDKINTSKEKGMNVNKFLSYLSLSNSATEAWDDFDIRKTVVVNDLETDVPSLVDYINNKTYEITRKEMDVPITHTDGCGLILPKKSKKSFMVRMPWVKGLLVPFSFDRFARECGNSKVTDIYGVEHDILAEKIEVILTKSQFKMWKYYSSWVEYQELFETHNCKAAKCNEEEDAFSDVKLNYQMLQTLNEMTDPELKTLSNRTVNSINKIGSDKKTMLEVLGVKKSNKEKTYFQQALELYPSLLTDPYSKEVLKDVKKSMVKKAKAGKLDIDGHYTYIIPDLYAFCEFLFKGEKNPKGLIQDGEIFCSLFKDSEDLDCLRSPHLYREHAIRKNNLHADLKRWFITKGMYTSVHDSISKLLMFDVDGDKALVTGNKIMVESAKKHMEGIVPLYYEMGVADKEPLNPNTLFTGLKNAYSGGNIGIVSNNISKIWNSEHVDLEVIKWLCMENNFIIDYAKTLLKLERPEEQKERITEYTRNKLPYFFISAKDKKEDQVVKVPNNSVVNRLGKIIPNSRLVFKKLDLPKFKHQLLMKKIDFIPDQAVIDKYEQLHLGRRFIRMEDNQLHIFKHIREEILKINPDIDVVVNTLVEYTYVNKKSSRKETLWESFGDIIVENIKTNLDARSYCQNCGTEIPSIRGKMYCDDCAKEKEKIRKREAWRQKNAKK